MVELRPVVRHEADPLDAEVIHPPAVVGTVHPVVDGIPRPELSGSFVRTTAYSPSTTSPCTVIFPTPS